MIGFININKNVGDGSTRAVSKVKRLFKTPCGHMGTLDPLASGVLPIGVGKATRLFNFLLDKQKTYIAEFEFGYLTDTLDCTGAVLKSGGRIPAKEEITYVLGDFLGEIDQIPPAYSAKMVDGVRSYDLARRGIEVQLKPKRVRIDGVTCLEQKEEGKFSFRIVCGGGTYIRSIARDLGEKLGTYCTMTALKRTAAGVFTIENSITVEELLSSEHPEELIIPADTAVSYPKVFLSESQGARLLNGVYDDYGLPEGLYRVYTMDEFWGIGVVENSLLKMKAYCRECLEL